MILERSQHGGISFTKSQCKKDCLWKLVKTFTLCELDHGTRSNMLGKLLNKQSH